MFIVLIVAIAVVFAIGYAACLAIHDPARAQGWLDAARAAYQRAAGAYREWRERGKAR